MCNEILDEAASSAATKWSGKVFSCQQCPGSRGSFQRRGTYFFCPGILSISRCKALHQEFAPDRIWWDHIVGRRFLRS